MVMVCVWLVWLSITVSVGSSYLVIGSDGINLTRDGQEVLELRIDMRKESRAYRLRLEQRSAGVWLVGEEGQLTKTKQEVNGNYRRCL